MVIKKCHTLGYWFLCVLFFFFDGIQLQGIFAENEFENIGTAVSAMDDELLLFEEIPIVISASRQAQPINRSSVPVSVITSEDIHYSGAKTIAETLNHVPGVDLLQIDRTRFALGIRGLHETFSDRTLTLIDGRIADSPLFGGSEFLRLPVLLDDIDRIEVVRGPGGAAWGANAFNGVINIIMKEPEDVLGFRVSSALNDFGDTYTSVRWGESIGDWQWRLSFGYQDRESSKDALTNENFFSKDFSKDYRSDGEAIYQITEETKLSFGVGFSYRKEGDHEVAGFFSQEDGTLRTIRSFVRLDHVFENDIDMYVQWFGNFQSTDQPSLAKSNASENDLETQFNFTAFESHNLSIGGNLRFIYLKEDSTDLFQVKIPSSPENEGWVGFFAIDRWEISDRFTFETQARVDYYSETDWDWSGRATGIYSLTESNEHILRLSLARAFRAPLISLRDLRATRLLPLPPLGALTQVDIIVPPQNKLENEGIFSFEVGYNWAWMEGLNLRVDSYFQRYSDLIGFVAASNGLGITQANINGATAFGGEIEVSYRISKGKVSVWYAYNDFETDKNTQSIRAFLPALHKMGINSRYFLPKKFVFNANYKYSDFTPVAGGDTTISSADSFNQLDLTLGKHLGENRAEILIGVMDIFNETEMAVNGLDSTVAHDTPGRTFFIELFLNF